MKLNFLEKILISWGLFWGVLGLGLYFLGLVGLFYHSIVIGYGAVCFLILIFFFFWQKVHAAARTFYKNSRQAFRKDRVIALALVGFGIFAVLNFLIDLGPEVGFDALWYHLTLPKIYLITHNVYYIKGGLLYYSVMPRLAEMIYGFGLALNPGGMLPKIIHYLFGLFWFSGIYIFVRLFLSRKMALLAALAGYGTYLVTWLSQTAYIDLIVAFFAVMTLWGVFKYNESLRDRQRRPKQSDLSLRLQACGVSTTPLGMQQSILDRRVGLRPSRDDNNKYRFLYLSAIFMGLVLASKLYGLFLLAAVILILIFKSNWRMTLRFFLISLIIVLPFYLQAYLATGNPFYPVFSIQDSALAMYTNGYSSLKDWYIHLWWKELPGLFWQMLVYRFTPFFGLIFLIFFAKNWQRMIWPLIIFLVFFILWSLNPVQEPRYFIVILPIIALISFYIFENINWRVFKVITVILLLVGLIYNFSFAFGKFKETLEMVFGKNPRENYLKDRLTPPRNYYDFSGNFSSEVQNSKVLTVNVHNLFYIDFNFYDWSFIENRYKNQTIRDIADSLNHNDFKFVLIGEHDISWWLGANQDDSAKYFQLILSQDGFNLYQLKMD